MLPLVRYPSTHFKTFQKTLPIEKLPDFDLQEFEKIYPAYDTTKIISVITHFSDLNKFQKKKTLN